MSEPREPGLPGPAQIRLIAVTLLIGAVLFGGIVAYLRVSTTVGGDVDEPYFDDIAAGIGVLLVALAFVLRNATFRRGASGTAKDKALAYVTGVLMFFAMLEASMLLDLVAVLLLPAPWLNVGVAVLALALGATSLPSEEQRDNAGLRP